MHHSGTKNEDLVVGSPVDISQYTSSRGWATYTTDV